MPSAAHTRRKRAGFSLVEMLAALLVLSLMTGLVASGVSAGTRMYQQERFESQAQVLAGTIQSTLADPVRFMQKSGETYTLKYEGNSIAFSGSGTPLHVDEEGRLYLLDANSGAERVKLLNDGIYGTCKVTDLSSHLNATVDASGETSYVFEGSYTITGPSNMSKDFAFAIVPQFGVSRDSSASSGSGSSGGGNAGEAADKSALADQLSAARSELAAGTDKPESAVTALQNAIEAAQAVYDNANAKQSDVSAQVAELIAARAAFAKASNSSALNYDGLKTLMDAVDALGTLRRDDQNLVNNLQTAYQNAKTAYDGKTATGQQQIDGLSTALQNALNAYNNGRYTGDLRSAISNANAALQTERIDRDGITAALNNALSNAQAAANNPANYSQAQIDQYTTTLQSATTAYNNLEKKSSGGGGGDGDKSSVSVAGFTVKMPVEYNSTSSDGRFTNADRDAISSNGGMHQGDFYVIGQDVYYCNWNSTEYWNYEGSLVKMQGFTCAGGSISYAGTPVDADSYDSNGAFIASYGQVVKQSGHLYLTVATSNYYGGYLKCADAGWAFVKLD